MCLEERSWQLRDTASTGENVDMLATAVDPKRTGSFDFAVTVDGLCMLIAKRLHLR